MVVVSAAVEGLLDEAVAKRLIVQAGASPGSIYGKNGKGTLRSRIAGYNNAARHALWLVIVDLDNDAPCAPEFRQTWLPSPAQHLCFRIAVHEIESWLLADKEQLARFLSVPVARVPNTPEDLADPKKEMVGVASSSRSRPIREDMVPRPGSGRSVGPAYTSRLIEFTQSRWRPMIARRYSESLRGAMDCLGQLVNAGNRALG